MKTSETPRTRAKRRTPRRSLPSPSVPLRLPDDHEIARQKTVWLAVMVTLVIAVGWLAVTRWDISGGSNPFQVIADQVSKVFSKQGTVASDAADGATSADDAKLKELRSLVFPQFTDTNTTTNKE